MFKPTGWLKSWDVEGSLYYATLGGWVGGHVDHMGEGLEDKIALAGVGGLKSYVVNMFVRSRGTFQQLPQSACAF